ncbi:GPP34 family phosphoprotein [Saccharopolyspora sp. NPDC050389]|uniref:GOLPH3/VPS74 family protein n=1 Tax=Saccharopolyspora sp. NPDC050389 TaxID=3155516 RepID=UPI0033FDA919
MPELSLAAKAFLLAYDADKQDLTRKRHLGIVLRGAVLAELAIAGLLVDSGGKAEVSAAFRPADPFLADALAEIGDSRLAGWKSLVRRNGGATYARVRDSLVERGVIRIGSRRALGVAPVEQIIATDPAGVRELQSHVVGVLRGAVPVHEVAREDAALVGLASAGRLLRKRSVRGTVEAPGAHQGARRARR